MITQINPNATDNFSKGSWRNIFLKGAAFLSTNCVVCGDSDIPKASHPMFCPWCLRGLHRRWYAGKDKRICAKGERNTSLQVYKVQIITSLCLIVGCAQHDVHYWRGGFVPLSKTRASSNVNAGYIDALWNLLRSNSAVCTTRATKQPGELQLLLEQSRVRGLLNSKQIHYERQQNSQGYRVNDERRL